MHIVSLVKKQHCPEVAYPLVGILGAGRQLQRFHLSEMGRVSQHVDVKQFGHVATSEAIDFLMDSTVTNSNILTSKCSLSLGRYFGCRHILCSQRLALRQLSGRPEFDGSALGVASVKAFLLRRKL